MIAQVSYKLIAIIYVISKVSENILLVLKICLTLRKSITSTCAKFQENRDTPAKLTEPRVRVTCSMRSHSNSKSSSNFYISDTFVPKFCRICLSSFSGVEKNVEVRQKTEKILTKNGQFWLHYLVILRRLKIK